MRSIRSAGVAILVVGVLFCLGFSAPAQAQDPFTITLTKSSPQACGSTGDTSPACNVDSAAGGWSFSISVRGKVSFLGLQIKNNPGAGDICWHQSFRQPSGTFSVSASNIPAAATNACGDQYRDTNGEPLTVFAYIQTGDANASVSIIVTYPAETALKGPALRPLILAGLRSHQPAIWREFVAIPEKRRA